jgi:hypothetical protein
VNAKSAKKSIADCPRPLDQRVDQFTHSRPDPFHGRDRPFGFASGGMANAHAP